MRDVKPDEGCFAITHEHPCRVTNAADAIAGSLAAGISERDWVCIAQDVKVADLQRSRLRI
jgi:hypothetical protein